MGLEMLTKHCKNPIYNNDHLEHYSISSAFFRYDR